jgi:choline dehydrogenase-like flavoprotein
VKRVAEHYDLIVVGSGPGGASLAQRLAPTGKRILILERGDYLPREEANWSAQGRLRRRQISGDETWTNAKRRQLQPGAALLCRRQLQGLRRRALPAARARFRRGPACRRRLARLAAQV